MVEADLRGHSSHGLIRLAGLVQSIRKGIVNPDPVVKILSDRPAGCLLDGDAGLGAYVGREAIRLAMSKARDVGVGVVGVRNGHYTGLLGYFSDFAVREGLVAIIASGDASHGPRGGGAIVRDRDQSPLHRCAGKTLPRHAGHGHQ